MTTGSEIEARVLARLEAMGVPFERIEIDPDFADTAAFCARYGFRLEESGNTILVVSKKEPKRYCACVIQASARLDVNHAVCRLLGVKKASFAGAEETGRVTGMMIGGVTCFALPAGLPIYVDRNLMDREFVVLGGGSRSVKIRVSPAVFPRIAGAQIVADLALAARPGG